MTPLRELAAKIPAEYRKEMLDMNMINAARDNRADPAMQYLLKIAANYLDEENITCPLCIGRILQNFLGLQPELIAMEKEGNILKDYE